MQRKPSKSATSGKVKPGKIPVLADDAEEPVLHLVKTNSADIEKDVHVMRCGARCETDYRGHATPQARSPLELVLDASEGFIPLWARNSTLRWKFRESSFQAFQNPSTLKNAVERLFGQALLAWGDAAPVRFAKRSDAWDFEIVMMRNDDCDMSGCVLASAFFPDSGRHRLNIYPKMFELSTAERIETLAHEIGHIFGLRHFFAKVSEQAWPSEIFGTHSKFSIMNYGENSRLTSTDKADLKRLYQAAWAGTLTQINGTPIKFMAPFHTFGRFS
jgi:Matrixin